MRSLIVLTVALWAAGCASALQDPQTGMNTSLNTTANSKRLFTYAGPLLPSDWSLISMLNDRVVIGFENNTARSARLDELEPRERTFVQRLQNGTLVSTPLSSAKEKLSQWSSSVTSTVSKFGKSVREQFDSLVNSDKSKNKDGAGPMNITMMVN